MPMSTFSWGPLPTSVYLVDIYVVHVIVWTRSSPIDQNGTVRRPGNEAQLTSQTV